MDVIVITYRNRSVYKVKQLNGIRVIDLPEELVRQVYS